MTAIFESVVDYGRFAERLATPQGRWDLLGEVQREWGFEPEEWEPDDWDIELWEVDYWNEEEPGIDRGLPVPVALREWWTWPENTFNANARWYWTHPASPPTQRPAPSGYHDGREGIPSGSPLLSQGGDRRVCVFMSEYQYCNEWGYAAAEAGQDDPRVLVSEEDEGWRVQSRSISEYFLQLALVRLPGRLGWTLSVKPDDLKADLAALDRLITACPDMGLLPWRECAGDVLLRGGPDLIVRHDRNPSADEVLHIAGRTEAAVRHAAGILGPVCLGRDPMPQRPN
ncbi:hypothetical protein AB0F07_22075 [Streptomyces fructofermentans]|uniref:hypothetical protein n=1 Tax=Streptomyces fructofermentans TaxID=152141 RepID=UPI0033C4FEDA